MGRVSALFGAVVVALVGLTPMASAQKSGDVLRITHRDSPANLSIHESGTISVVLPAMGIFNNLVMYDQSKKQNSSDTIVPDLAVS